jgi:ribonuclease BN (tRNA processing enzyme)
MDRAIRGFLKRPFTSPPFLLPTKLRFHSLDGKARFPFKFDMRKLRHSVPCYGYRFEFAGAAVSYCTDTGECANLARLASKADLFITECAMEPKNSAPNIFHITPETAARVAVKAMAKRLALFHFDPGKYPSFASRSVAEDAAKEIFHNTIAAHDATAIVL